MPRPAGQAAGIRSADQPASGLRPRPGEDDQHFEQAAAKRRLRHSLIGLVMLVLVAVGLIAAVPSLEGVEDRLGQLSAGWVLLAVALELLSGHGYVYSFAVVFPRRPLRFTTRMPWVHFVARVAWLEQGFQAVMPAGGAAAEVPGALVLRSRGMPWGWIAERSTVLFLLTSAINAMMISLFGLGLAVGILPGPSGVLFGVLPAALGGGVLLLFLVLPRVLDRLLERPDQHRLHIRAAKGLAGAVREVQSIVFACDWRLLGPLAYLVFDIAVLWVCFTALGTRLPSQPSCSATRSDT